MKKETSYKLLLILFLGIFLTSILSYAVLAADDPATDIDAGKIQETSKEAGKALLAPFIGVGQGVLEAIFGGGWAIGTRVFMFVLLILVLWSIVPLITGDDKKMLNFVISFVIAALSIMAIPPELLDTILTSYGAMGATMLTVIPFAIILLFSVRVQNALLARVIWIFYAFYYLGLYFYEAYRAPTVTGKMLYILAFLLGIALFFGVGKIRDILFKGKMDAIEETGKQVARRARALHKNQKRELEESYSDSGGI